MDYFQIYNRETNEWDTNFQLVSGWNENFVLDRTTDTATIKTKYAGNSVPNYKFGDWCRILHEEVPSYSATLLGGKNVLISNLQTHTEIVDNTITITFNVNIYDVFVLRVYYTDTDGNSHTSRHTVNRNLVNYNSYTFITDYQVDAVTDIDIIQAQSHNYLITFNQIVFKPTNHEQFIIGNSQYVKNKATDEWDCTFSLKEPIEITSGIMCETLSFTNQGDKAVIEDGMTITYKHEPYNCLSALERVLKVTPANNNLDNSWFGRIKILKQAELKAIPFNDVTYNELSLYQILMDKYDSLVGKTPVLYFDIDRVTDKPFNLAKTTYVLDFMRQDGFDTEEIELSDLAENNSQYIISNSEDNMIDGVISNFENLSVPNGVRIISETLWAVPQVDTFDRDVTNYGVNSEVGAWVIKTQHNIKSIKSIKVFKLRQQSTYVAGWQLDRYEVDNVQILEKQQYDASDTYYKTRNCFWYENGTNIIHINEYYYTGLLSESGENVSYLYLYNIEYEPYINARYDLGKDYQTQLNQVGSQVSNEAFGEYLKNYIASLNKYDITIQKTISDWNDVIKIGTRVNDNGKKYIITNVSVQNRGFDYDVVYQLNENHIRKSDSIEAPQEVRDNLAITSNSTKPRMSNYCKNYLLTRNISKFNDNELNDKDIKGLLSCLHNDVGNYPQFVLVSAISFLKDSDGVQSSYVTYLLGEVTRYILNNTLMFNVCFEDNAMAGTKKHITNYSLVINIPYANIIDNIRGKVDRQVPVLSTDYFGEIQQLYFHFINLNNEDIYTLEEPTHFTHEEDLQNWINKVNDALSITENYPIASSEFIAKYMNEISNPIIKIENINYYKDTNEMFNYTIGMHVQADENIILNNNLFNNSIFMNKNADKITKIIYFDNNITLQDFNASAGNEVTIQSKTFISGESESRIEPNKIVIQLQEQLNNPKSVVLCFSNNTPALIINDFNETTDTITFYC